MLNLPKIPYKMEKNKSQIVAMRGINLSNMISDGDMVDSKNISARAYPYITTRKARDLIGEYSSATAMTTFMDKLVYVEGNNLHWGDVCWENSVSVGEKQFAAINSKLVIMPDKIYIDGDTGELGHMGARRHIHAELTENSIVAGEGYSTWFEAYNCYVDVDAGRIIMPRRRHISGDTNILMRWYKLSSDTSTRRLTPQFREFIPIKGECNLQIRSISSSSSEGKGYLEMSESDMAVLAKRCEIGDELFLEARGNKEFKLKITSFDPEENKVNCDNISLVENADNIIISRIFVDVTDPILSTIGDGGYMRAKMIKELYGKEFPEISDYIVNLSEDKKTKVIEFSGALSSVSNSWFVCYFDNLGYDGSIKSDIYIGDTIQIKADENKVVEVTVTEIGDYEHGEYIAYKVEGEGTISVGDHGHVEIQKQSDISGFKIGDAVTISGSSDNDLTFVINDIKDGVIFAESNIFTTAEGESFTIERRVPDLDYICESDNRIWGCSNSNNTIYASALGDPTNFFDYSGESTDSFAVAVGSPERFTACCRYGGGVLFFKENKIHKILGSYPAEYTLYSYDVEGVQEGCHKSLQIINELLYYKGIHGVFTYNGTPRLISANFGDVVLWNAVAGNDGDTYYISMDGVRRSYLLAYEIKHGLWVLEDDTRIVDFIKSGSTLRMLAEDGKFYLCDARDSKAGIEWYIQFTPFYETIEGQKSYSRIVFRLEMAQGSYMIVDVKTDGGAWHEAGKVVGRRDGIIPVNVPINRCDKFEIRLRGKGKCTIHQMKREFFVGGDK